MHSKKPTMSTFQLPSQLRLWVKFKGESDNRFSKNSSRRKIWKAHTRQFLAVRGRVSYDRHRSSMTLSSMLDPRRVHHYSPLLTTAHHSSSLRTTAHHCAPLRTTAHLCFLVACDNESSSHTQLWQVSVAYKAIATFCCSPLSGFLLLVIFQVSVTLRFRY